MENKVELGDKVRCKYSGFEGTVTAKTEFINGCVQFSVIAKHPKSKDFIPPEETALDEQSVVVIKKLKKEPIKKEESNGGPIRMAPKMRGY